MDNGILWLKVNYPGEITNILILKTRRMVNYSLTKPEAVTGVIEPGPKPALQVFRHTGDVYR